MLRVVTDGCACAVCPEAVSENNPVEPMNFNEFAVILVERRFVFDLVIYVFSQFYLFSFRSFKFRFIKILHKYPGIP